MKILLCESLWYYVLILDWMETLMVVSLYVYGIKDLNEWVVYVIACVCNSNPRRQFVTWIMPRIFQPYGGMWGEGRLPESDASVLSLIVAKGLLSIGFGFVFD